MLVTLVHVQTRPLEKKDPSRLGNATRDQIYVHAASGIAHASFDGTKLLCGRPLIAVYKSLDDVQMEASDLVICKQCGRAA